MSWRGGRGRSRGGGGGSGRGRINLAKKLVEYAPTESSDVSSLSDFTSGALDNVDLTDESTFMKVCSQGMRLGSLYNDTVSISTLLSSPAEIIQGVCCCSEEVSLHLKP